MEDSGLCHFFLLFADVLVPELAAFGLPVTFIEDALVFFFFEGRVPDIGELPLCFAAAEGMFSC